MPRHDAVQAIDNGVLALPWIRNSLNLFQMIQGNAAKTMPPAGKNRLGALAESACAAEPVDQLEGAVQPAFSAISRPCMRELDSMNTSS